MVLGIILQDHIIQELEHLGLKCLPAKGQINLDHENGDWRAVMYCLEKHDEKKKKKTDVKGWKWLWKLKIPTKFKTFLWLVFS